MEQSVSVGVEEAVKDQSSDDPARKPLIALSSFAGVAVVTGTFLYCYPDTLQAVRRAMILMHDLSGDLMILSGAVYLWIHLKRVWRMWRMKLSRWSGYVAVAVWIIAAVTGVYGQIWDMKSGSDAWTIHTISSVALVVLACFHGGYGLRRRFQ